MSLKIYDDSKNYTAVVVKLTNTFPLPGLDNLVGVSIFGNVCLIPKSYDLNATYIFFPSGAQLSKEYLSENNLFRNSNLNEDQKSKGYFEDNGRIKAIKLKGNKSTGIVMPLVSLTYVIGANDTLDLKVGDEFNEISGECICKKWVLPSKGANTGAKKQNKVLDEIIDSKMFPQHLDTDHLLKYIDKLNLTDEIVITTKLHGTSARIGHTLTKRKLKWHEKIAKKFGVKVVEEEYSYVVGSRKVVKSVNFSELKDKNHFYDDDLWTMVSHASFDGKLNKGEMVYFEIIGTDYNGGHIQQGYTYNFKGPAVYVYRITNINSQGIEVDLPWGQVRQRCTDLGVEPVMTSYKGLLGSYLYHWVGLGKDVYSKPDFTWIESLENYLKKEYLDKPAILDNSVIEEGICIRVEKYPRPHIYKLKSPLFVIHESNQADKEIVDLETQN